MTTEEDLSLLDLPESKLEIMIGEAVRAGAFGAKDMTDVQKQEVARNWLARRLPAIRNVICTPHMRNSLFGARAEERNLLFAAVVDALGSLHGLEVPVTLLSARLIHYGLNRVCESEDSEQ